MAFVLLKVKYGGDWVDCTYEGGLEIDIPLFPEDMNVFNVRYSISQNCNLTVSNFEVFYLKTSRNGRIVKTRLRTNDQVMKLFTSSPSPTVYVCSDVQASRSHDGASSSYVPVFDQSQAYNYNEPFVSQGNDWHEELEQFGRLAASDDWIDNQYYGGGNFSGDPLLERTIPDLNDTPHEGREQPLSDNNDDDEDDGDYIPEGDTSSESEDNCNMYHQGRRMNTALFAEWTAWIHNEGGMQKLLNMMYPDDYTNNAEVDTDTDHMANWIVPVVPPRPRDSEVFHDATVDISELGPHSIFDDKKQIMIAVGLWHLEARKEFKVIKSDHRRMVMRCKVKKDCPFNLRLISEGDAWTMSSYRLEHNCDGHTLTNIHERKVKSSVIGSIFAKRIARDSQIIKPRIIMNELLSNYGVEASYDACLKGRNKAIEMVYGTYQDSFSDLLGYLYMLKQRNPGTFTAVEIRPNNRFKHVFIALSASISGYTSGYIRPVISIDGTHLKGKNYNGVLFVAVAKDANEQLFPLAYGIGPVEDNESWVWFLKCLRSAYGNLQGHLVVSDMHPAIAHAMNEVLPDAVHALCFYHLMKNLVRYGKNVMAQFTNTAYAYDQPSFEKGMLGLYRTSRLAYNRLMAIGPAKWARYACPARRFSNMTSNAAESFNNTLLWARRLPICPCLDAIRIIIEEWFRERREKCKADNEQITTEARRKLVVQYERSQSYRAAKINDVPQYRVRTAQREVEVDLRRYTCECSRWQQDCLPCAHAIAAIRKEKVNIVEYVSPYYLRSNYAMCFAVPVNGVPKKAQWRLPPNLAQREVEPPPIQASPGKTSRNTSPSQRRTGTKRSSTSLLSALREYRTCGRRLSQCIALEM